MKSIPLTNDLSALVDDDDYERLRVFKWGVHRDEKGHVLYATRKMHRRRAVVRNATIWMHREVIGAVRGQKVDHIDGDGLNNQKANLRIATQFQNNWNQKKRRGSSRFKGVYRRKDCPRWHAQIQGGTGPRYLGLFVSEEDAAKAYDAEARARFGEYACLNFPTTGERGALV